VFKTLKSSACKTFNRVSIWRSCHIHIDQMPVATLPPFKICCNKKCYNTLMKEGELLAMESTHLVKMLATERALTGE
jgi:hypothetical protein